MIVSALDKLRQAIHGEALSADMTIEVSPPVYKAIKDSLGVSGIKDQTGFFWYREIKIKEKPND